MQNELDTDVPESKPVQILAAGVNLNADLTIPKDAKAIVAFAHGSGSSRHSSRNRYVAKTLNGFKFATLLADLLTEEEERTLGKNFGDIKKQVDAAFRKKPSK